jgi:Phasin protein
MPTTDQDKPSGKPRQRNRKANQPGQKPEQQQSPILDQQEEDQIEPMVTSVPASVPANGAATPADNYPISIQTIANAYGDYTRKSLLESRSFVEQLMAVRSLDKAIEVQTEFTRQTYANFVAESQKICELYREFARQIFQPWGFAAKMTEAGFASWPTVASQSKH